MPLCTSFLSIGVGYGARLCRRDRPIVSSEVRRFVESRPPLDCSPSAYISSMVRAYERYYSFDSLGQRSGSGKYGCTLLAGWGRLADGGGVGAASGVGAGRAVAPPSRRGARCALCRAVGVLRPVR